MFSFDPPHATFLDLFEGLSTKNRRLSIMLVFLTCEIDIYQFQKISESEELLV
jgi:hypothetical protein